jgi:ATP-dependent helicase/DNAse subunit B
MIMDIAHISVSRHQMFTQCPNAYKFRYHLKLEPEGPTPIHFVYGSIVHKICEDYVAAKGARTLEEVYDGIISGRVPYEFDKEGNPISAPELSLEHKRRLPNHMIALKKLTDRIGMDGETEYVFKYDLDPPHSCLVTGVIDRLFQHGNLWYIIDYKTTKKGMWRKDEQTVLKDLQLRCYARVVQREFNVPAENIRAALYYLEGANLIGAKFSHISLVEAEQELLETYKKISNMPEEKAWGNVGPHCKWCDFRKRCSFYSLT